MKAIVLVMSILAGTLAQADGFNCSSESGLNIKIYDHVQASEGTRSPAIMVVSNSAIGAGNKTIATFSDATGLLDASSLIFTSKVDLRYKNSNRGGELIAGTKLAFVDTIEMLVDFSYSNPVQAGEEIPAQLAITKRNHTTIVERAICVRYLKN